MKTLYVNYYTSPDGGDIVQGDDDSEYPSYEDTDLSVTLTGISRALQSTLCEAVEVPDGLFVLPELFAACVFYTDGDSFQATHGNLHVVGLFETRAEAEAAIKRALDDPEGYMPWSGYFASFDSSRVELLRVE